MIDALLDAQRRNRPAVAATSAAQRIEKLRRLGKAVMRHRNDIREAMWADFRKPAAEVDLSEIYPIVGEIRHAIRHLRKWMTPRRVKTRLALFGAASEVRYEPKGVVLILAPWNFPFNLTLGPLVSAIAAGNCAIVKPSELTPHSSACMRRILAEVFADDEVAIVEGDAKVAQELLSKRFDHIFFTGSPAVGKLVMKAAAENLTSVTLELGGKSPVIVDKTANLDEAAKSIAWGKNVNCGQVCVAPDYVLVDESVSAPFLEKLKSSLSTLGGETSRGVIVNDRHAGRIRGLFDSAVGAGAKVVTGGTFNERAIEPTVLTDVPPDSDLMREEIFGPLLPVLTYRTLDEAFASIESRETPLVLYAFSRDKATVKKILSRTSAGGTVVNHTMIHFYELNLPFGGTGHSGMGRSHGYAGFQAFSNERGVMLQKTRWSPTRLLMPPYKGWFKKFVIDFTVRWL